jgi:hypothetical protein
MGRFIGLYCQFWRELKSVKNRSSRLDELWIEQTRRLTGWQTWSGGTDHFEKPDNPKRAWILGITRKHEPEEWVGFVQTALGGQLKSVLAGQLSDKPEEWVGEVWINLKSVRAVWMDPALAGLNKPLRADKPEEYAWSSQVLTNRKSAWGFVQKGQPWRVCGFWSVWEDDPRGSGLSVRAACRTNLKSASHFRWADEPEEWGVFRWTLMNLKEFWSDKSEVWAGFSRRTWRVGVCYEPFLSGRTRRVCELARRSL